jgi:hypothetical protein
MELGFELLEVGHWWVVLQTEDVAPDRVFPRLSDHADVGLHGVLLRALIALDEAAR